MTATLTEEDVLHIIWDQEPFTDYDVQGHRLNSYIEMLVEKELVIRTPSNSTGIHVYALTGKSEKRIGVDE